jgi:hypothetical protein
MRARIALQKERLAVTNERLRKLRSRLAELLDRLRDGTLNAEGEVEVRRMTGGMSAEQALRHGLRRREAEFGQSVPAGVNRARSNADPSPISD